MGLQPAILFPDVPAAIIAYLDDLLVEPVVKKVPNPRPASFVTVVRTGGPRDSIVTEQAQITFEAWADDDAAASDLAQLCRAHLQALAGTTTEGVGFYRVDELSGPGDLPDPDSHQSRQTWTALVQVRGVPLTGS